MVGETGRLAKNKDPGFCGERQVALTTAFSRNVFLI